MVYVALLTLHRYFQKVGATHLGLRTLRSTRWTRVDTPSSLALYVPPCTTMARGMWSLQTLRRPWPAPRGIARAAWRSNAVESGALESSCGSWAPRHPASLTGRAEPPRAANRVLKRHRSRARALSRATPDHAAPPARHAVGGRVGAARRHRRRHTQPDGRVQRGRGGGERGGEGSHLVVRFVNLRDLEHARRNPASCHAARRAARQFTSRVARRFARCAVCRAVRSAALITAHTTTHRTLHLVGAAARRPVQHAIVRVLVAPLVAVAAEAPHVGGRLRGTRTRR
eukprot:scaffold11459_cov64-Phaeocystis_antarctica.AAC.2